MMNWVCYERIIPEFCRYSEEICEMLQHGGQSRFQDSTLKSGDHEVGVLTIVPCCLVSTFCFFF